MRPDAGQKSRAGGLPRGHGRIRHDNMLLNCCILEWVLNWKRLGEQFLTRSGG
jgi:hypothetical protein